MFPVNSVLGPSAVQKEVFLVSSFLKKFPTAKVIHFNHVSSRNYSLSKEESKSEALPSLPVQPLEQVMEKYIKSIKPFVDRNQFEKTKELAKKFCEDENLGRKLEKLLQERAKSMENWLSDWWLDVAYLEYRNPLIVYSSPVLVWPEQKFKNQDEQLLYTAHVISAALDFFKLIEEDKIPQEKMGGKNLCMSQYGKLFGACRIPKKDKDELLIQNPKKSSNNIIVMYNNHFFTLSVFENNSRKPLSVEHFYAMLLDIVAEGDAKPGVPIGILTTGNRDNWAKAYEELKKDNKNAQMLEEYVEKALFVVCIDKPLSVGSGHEYLTRCSKLLLHGFGGRGNAGNRWYEKTVQFVIGAGNDGVGIAYEHSPAEGGPVGVLTNFIAQKTKTLTPLKVPERYSKPQKLEFSVSESVKQAIARAEEAVNKINDELDVYGWSFTHFGKETIKKCKVSPDSFIQVAIQLAFYKLHKQPAAQYESGSLRKFIHGRTDVIRTCSEEVVKFCETMTNPRATREEKEKALRNAIAAHKKYAEEVLDGRGVDRYLLGLKILSQQNNMTPEIFSDEAYKRSTNFRLSTSNVPTECDGFMVYGPLTDDGYACCYNPRPNNINFGTSTWAYCRETRLNSFKEALEESLIEMKDCLLNTEKEIKSKL